MSKQTERPGLYLMIFFLLFNSCGQSRKLDHLRNEVTALQESRDE